MSTSFIEAPQPWWIFNDASGNPLAGGEIYTYDSLTRQPKATYKDAGGLDEQEFPITLDGSGMVQNPIFWELNGTSGYYIEIYDSEGNLLRTEDNFPLSIGGGGGGGPINEYFESTNYIDNIDFKFNNGNIIGVPVGDTQVAPGGWFFRKAENFAVFDEILFTRISLSSTNPLYNPEYLLTYTATSFTGSETEKSLFKKISNVKSFDNEVITISFYAFSTLSSPTAEIIVIQHFGTGGSPSPDNIQLFPFPFSGIVEETITVASTIGQSLGTNGDDYIAIGFRYPLSTPGSFACTLFSIVRGELTNPNGFFDTPSQTYSKCIQDLLSTMFPFYTTGFVVQFFVDYGAINSVPTKYAISGFLGMENQTIGSASSGAVEANNQYMNLFIYLWQSTIQLWCPVSGGRGASAQADWAANKAMVLPHTQGRVSGCVGTGASLSTRVMAETFGEENHQLTVAELASHIHTISPMTPLLVAGGSHSNVYAAASGNVNTNPTGSNVAHNTMQPTVFNYWYIKY
jgi:hypothetical protein